MTTPSAVGIVVALASEAKAVAGRNAVPGRSCACGDAAVLHAGGMGVASADRAARTLLAGDGVRALASVGFSGAIDPALRCGDWLVPAAVLHDGARYDCDAEWRNRVHARLGEAASDATLLTVHATTLTATARAHLRERSGAGAVDMESAAVAKVAREAGIPFVALRVVLDEARIDLPEIVGRTDPYGRPRWSAFAASLLLQPAQIAGVVQLARAFARASRRLKLAIARTGPDLAFGGSRGPA